MLPGWSGRFFPVSRHVAPHSDVPARIEGRDQDRDGTASSDVSLQSAELTWPTVRRRRGLGQFVIEALLDNHDAELGTVHDRRCIPVASRVHKLSCRAADRTRKAVARSSIVTRP